MSTEDHKRDEVHADRGRKKKDQSIVISEFKTDIPPIMGGLAEGKESSAPAGHPHNRDVEHTRRMKRILPKSIKIPT